jgi:hypothetical protein
MGKSFDPMLKEKAGSGSRAHSRRSSASMSLQSAIPRRVALQQRTPLLHRLQSACDRLTLPVNRYGNDGNIAEPVNFNRPPEPPGGQTENRDFHLGIAENCPNNRDHRKRFGLHNGVESVSLDGLDALSAGDASAFGIKFDTIAPDGSIAGHKLEGCSLPYAGINH